MVEGKYDDSTDITPEDIARDDELHRLTDKKYLISRYKILRKALIKLNQTPSDADIFAIITIITENNRRLLKVLNFTRH